MVFNAAKDLVYTINGNIISSGGYRISKILNGKSKKKGKQAHMQEGGNGRNIYSEDSGIPVGLLLLQRLHFETEHRDHDNEEKNKNANDFDAIKIDSGSDSNKKLVYASIMTDNGDDDNNDGENIELVIPDSHSHSHSSGVGFTCANSYSENPVEISSNEIDDELYDSLVKSVLGPGGTESIVIKQIIPLQKTNSTNSTKKQHFGKHIEKVFQKRKTRSKRHEK
jgi:hypothetical protein